MGKVSKRMKAMEAKLPKAKAPMPLTEAVDLLKQFNTTKFDQTVEISMRLGVDPKQSDQIVRGSVVLPNGIGKTLRVLVFAKDAQIDEATAAGADYVGGPELAQKIKDGWFDFDVCIATPNMMGVVGSLGRLLGPRGLMPSPKAGTVTMELEKTIKEYKAGKVEFRNDKGGIVHAVSDMSFSVEKGETLGLVGERDFRDDESWRPRSRAVIPVDGRIQQHPPFNRKLLP